MKTIFSTLLLSFAVLLGAQTVYQSDFAEELDSWRPFDVKVEVIDGAMRLRETGTGVAGRIVKNLPVAEGFLQIKVGQIEHDEHYPRARNQSKGANFSGRLFTGWNTFVMPEHQRRSFTLSLIAVGPRGTATGGWMDIERVRIVSELAQGITVDSEDDKSVVGVGDAITIECHADSGLGELVVRCFYIPTMSEVNFGNPIILREVNESGVYSASLTIDSTANRLLGPGNKPIGGGSLSFVVQLPSGHSYTSPAFDFSVDTKIPLPPGIGTGYTPITIKYQELWEKATTGTNLAFGKPVEFSVQPNFRLTRAGETDAADLTDGRLSTRKDGILRFDPLAVGWRSGDDLSDGIDMIVDLGKVNPVEKAVIRISCGEHIKNIQRSPRSIQTLVSKNGKDWYRAGELIKLEPGEKDQSNFINQFYLEENDQDIFVYPFELAINADARFVALRIVPDGGNLYSDELAIIRAEARTGDFNAAYAQPVERMFADGVVMTPAQSGIFYVADNINAPNYFRMRDLRKQPDRKARLIQVIELPDGITAIERSENYKTETIVRDGLKYIRWSRPIPATNRVAYFEHNPWFFKAEKGLEAKDAKAYFYVTIDGTPSHIVERDVEIIAIPENTARFRGQTVLNRMAGTSYVTNAWPGLFQNLKLLGFTGVMVYPYVFHPDFPREYLELITEIRNNEFSVWMCDDTFIMPLRRFLKTPGAELFCQLEDGNKAVTICPSYRGPVYKAEVDRIADCTAAIKPDFIMWDIEFWGRSLAAGVRRCTRCQAAQAKSGKPWPEFLDELSVEINRDITAAALRGSRKAGGPEPVLYNYNRQAMFSNYHGFEKWELNRQFVAGSMPSLYVAGSELLVHENISGNFAAQEDKTQRLILPILTPNTYGQYEPYRLEQMIYESMLNGAGGFLYYPWRGFFSPIYFYYHSKAMVNVAKYQDLIFDGEIFTPSGSNAEMTYSGVKKTDEMLLLVGNYRHAAESTTVEPPFNRLVEIIDVLDNKNIPVANPLKLDVSRGRVRLVYIKAESAK